MIERLINNVQQAYGIHRAPETWGTPEVSPYFFNKLRNKRLIRGLLSGWNDLVDRERTLGDLDAKPEIKAFANLLASILLVLGVRKMSGISDEERNEAEYIPSIRTKAGEFAFSMTLGLLFFAQGSVTYIVGRGEDGETYSAKLNSQQAAKVADAVPSVPGCSIDAVAEVCPDKLRLR